MDLKLNNTEKISLIVPVYNGEKFLSQLLDSVLIQDYENWECICVDDAGTDSSIDILNDYAKKDNRFKIISKENGGVGDARNVAMQSATGTYILFADQDDLLHPNCFSLAIKGITTAKSDILSFDYVKFNDNYDPEKIIFDASIIKFHGVANKVPFPGNVDSDILVWRHIFKRSAIANVKFPKLSGGEDLVFMSKLLFTNATWATMHLPLYANRQNELSCSRKISEKYINSGIKANDFIFEIVKDDISILPIWQKRFLHDEFYFALSIVLMHGHLKNSYSHFKTLKVAIENSVILGTIILPKFSLYAFFLKLILKEHFAILKFMAFTIGFILRKLKCNRSVCS